MDINEILLYIALPTVFLILTLTVVIIKRRKKTTKIEEEAILELFVKTNIRQVEYIRNKIVVSFKDVTLFEHNELKNYGATGISIIGDKVKFYFDDNKVTADIFEKIQKHNK